MRRRWWRFGWHPTLAVLPGAVTFHAHDGSSEEWTPLPFGTWWLLHRVSAPPPDADGRGTP